MDNIAIKSISRYKNILAAILVVIVFIGVNYNIFSKHSMEMEKLESEVKKINEGKKIIKRWGKTKADYKELSKVFLTEDAMAFKQFVREKANFFNTDIRSLKASYEEKDDYLEVPIHLKIIGFYKDFVGFIKAIEEKTIEVNNVRITRRKGSDVVDVDLSLKGLIIK